MAVLYRKPNKRSNCTASTSSDMLIRRTPKYLNTPTAEIELIGGGVAIVDAYRFDELSKFAWRRVKSHAVFYAVRRYQKNGITITERMHRRIAETPKGMVCHHINGDPFYNLDANLINLTRAEHEAGHSLNKI